MTRIHCILSVELPFIGIPTKFNLALEWPIEFQSSHGGYESLSLDRKKIVARTGFFTLSFGLTLLRVQTRKVNGQGNSNNLRQTLKHNCQLLLCAASVNYLRIPRIPRTSTARTPVRALKEKIFLSERIVGQKSERSRKGKQISQARTSLWGRGTGLNFFSS